MVFQGVRAQVRDAISPILRYSKLFAAILEPECLVDFLFKGFLIIGCVPVYVGTYSIGTYSIGDLGGEENTGRFACIPTFT